MFIFPNITCTAGDLLFFYKDSSSNVENHGQPMEMREAITAASVVPLNGQREIFHVGMVAVDGSEQIVHASDDGVVLQSFAESIQELKPHSVELCRVELENEWKRRAAWWALEQLGAGYNDIYSPDCLNSKGERAFYCSQLSVESYKATDASGKSPFPPHQLNFLDANGKMLPFWLDYYRQLCPNNPAPPQGLPGSHPSKLRTAPIVHAVATYHFN